MHMNDIIAYFFKLKWPSGFHCPRCSHTSACTIETRNLPLYQCSRCRHQTSLTAGTVMEGSRTSLSKWHTAIHTIAQSNGINAVRLAALIKVTYKTAWAILHKIRLAISRYDNAHLLSGDVHSALAFCGNHNRETHFRHPKEQACVAMATFMDDPGPQSDVAHHIHRDFEPHHTLKNENISTPPTSNEITPNNLNSTQNTSNVMTFNKIDSAQSTSNDTTPNKIRSAQNIAIGTTAIKIDFAQNTSKVMTPNKAMSTRNTLNEMTSDQIIGRNNSTHTESDSGSESLFPPAFVPESLARIKFKIAKPALLHNRAIPDVLQHLMLNKHIDTSSSTGQYAILPAYEIRMNTDLRTKTRLLLSAFHQLKEWILFQFHGIGPKYLQNYFNEFCFRFNAERSKRRLSTGDQLAVLCMGNVT
ncbi:transposase [Paenibacillaceae bacterium]|nr:transposase [Paenibacillaceae bacterium]